MKKIKKNTYLLFDDISELAIALSPDAELIARRLVDLLWRTEAGSYFSGSGTLFNAIGKGFSFDRFKRALGEIFFHKIFIDDVDVPGNITCKPIIDAKARAAELRKKRAASGRKGGLAIRKPSAPPGARKKIDMSKGTRGPANGTKADFFAQIKKFNS